MDDRITEEFDQEPEPQKKRGQTVLMILLGALAVLLCGAAIFAGINLFRIVREPAPDQAVIFTQAAQTIVAQATLDAGQTAVAELTRIAGGGAVVIATPTLPPLYITPSPAFPTYNPPTLTFPPPLPPTWTPTIAFIPPPTATIPAGPPCNRAFFVKDVTIPDGSIIPPNSRFTKIWRVRNDGSCIWDNSYALVFASGTAMTSNVTQPIQAVVHPGQQIDLAIEMTAPGSPGVFTSNWLFRAPNGQTFGTGTSSSNPIYARIQVLAPPAPNPNFAYDFSANYCNATWRTNAGTISCNNAVTSTNGSVTYLPNPSLENRTEDEPGLLTRPNQSANGAIWGEYPFYTVKANDHFVALLSCQAGSTSCDVTFRLDYMLSNGSTGNLGSWREVFDGKTRTIDIDLSGLIGQSVQFILRMQNNGDVRQANGIWFLPSIRRSSPTNTPPPIPPTVTPTPTATNTPLPTDPSYP